MDQKTSIAQGSAQTSQSDTNPDLENVVVAGHDQPQMPDGDSEIIFEPLEQNPYQVSYTCLLLPRSVTHYLLGDVVDRLQAVLKKISVSFGWSLEFISIRPEYFQWAVRVPPSTSTTYVIQIIRKQTSEQIFSDFPRFKRENQMDDFWAPGYLLFWGSQPHPVEVIQSYIRQTRKQQGIQMDE